MVALESQYMEQTRMTLKTSGAVRRVLIMTLNHNLPGHRKCEEVDMLHSQVKQTSCLGSDKSLINDTRFAKFEKECCIVFGQVAVLGHHVISGMPRACTTMLATW